MIASNSTKRPRRIVREPKTETIASPEKTETSATAEHVTPPAEPKPPSKVEAVLTLLERAEGATLDELVEATGWLRHSTRAALTGLKKKGHQITRAKVEGVSRYSIARAAPQ